MSSRYVTSSKKGLMVQSLANKILSLSYAKEVSDRQRIIYLRSTVSGLTSFTGKGLIEALQCNIEQLEKVIAGGGNEQAD